jgi:RNA polymerase sigma-70 factor (sigma-E family)
MRLGPEFDDFVRDASPALLRTAYLLCGDRGHAEDLLQTALVRTARRWRVARDQPNAYTRRVLVNLAKDRWRDRSRRPAESAPVALEPSHDGGDEQRLLRHALLPAVLALPARQRAVLVLRYLDDLSVAETAQALGCTAGTVKSQTHAALARLRQLIADDTDLTLLTKEIEKC